MTYKQDRFFYFSFYFFGGAVLQQDLQVTGNLHKKRKIRLREFFFFNFFRLHKIPKANFSKKITQIKILPKSLKKETNA